MLLLFEDRGDIHNVEIAKRLAVDPRAIQGVARLHANCTGRERSGRTRAAVVNFRIVLAHGARVFLHVLRFPADGRRLAAAHEPRLGDDVARRGRDGTRPVGAAVRTRLFEHAVGALVVAIAYPEIISRIPRAVVLFNALRDRALAINRRLVVRITDACGSSTRPIQRMLADGTLRVALAINRRRASNRTNTLRILADEPRAARRDGARAAVADTIVDTSIVRNTLSGVDYHGPLARK